MFEGVQDQFHQFLAAASNSTPISSSSSSSHHQIQNPLPLPLSFSLLHGCTTTPSSSPSPSLFHDPYNPVQAHLHHQQILHHHHHQPLQHLQWAPPAAHTKQQQQQIGGGAIKQETQGEASTNNNSHHGFLSSTSLAMEREREERSMAADLTSAAAWSHDELLALLRIRSALENWFPEFTWEHVSRKLSELGFKRSPQKCKEKFEEESRSYFHTTKNNDVTAMENDVICPTTKNNYRLFNELEELCHHRHDPPPPPPPPPHHHHHHQQQQPMAVIHPRDEDENVNQDAAILDKQNPQSQEEEQLGSGGRELGQLERSLDENDGSEAIDKVEKHQNTRTHQRNKDRRNKKKKFEIFKSFCEEIVSKMMSQQEELHTKILQDMIKRDEVKTAREEAWKKQEMERINKEMEARARDLAMVSDRQAKIIEFLKKFASDSSTNTDKKDAINEDPKPAHQNPSSSATHSSPNHLPTSSNEGSISQSSNPSPNTNKNRPSVRKPRPNKRPRSENCSDGNDVGKRWPREEVLVLINIRCNVDLANKTGPDQNQNNNSSNNNSSSTKNLPLWERISHKMMEMGYNRSAKRCKEKWENINKYFRKTKDMNKNRSADSRTCPYFHQLSHLYNQGRVTGGGGGDGGGGGGGAMNVSDQGEDASGVQVTMSPACNLEF